MSVTKITALAVAIFLAAATSGYAQMAGFQAGIAPPAFGFPPTQAPVTVRGGTFTGIGGFFTPAPVIVPVPVQPLIIPQQPFFVPNQILVPQVQPFAVQNPVIIPNQVLLPGQTFVQQPFFTPAPAVVVPVPVVPAHPRAHVRTFGPRVPVPVIGTPVGELIRQFGHPTVSIVTRRGEILQFPGGVTVTIHNGKVAGPK